MQSILNEGKYGNYTLSIDYGRDNDMIEAKRRLGMSTLLLINEDTFNMIVNNNITLFHGTNANALPGIIKYGLCCVDNILDNGEVVKTGEVSTRIGGGRSFISFTDVLEEAANYSIFKPSEESKDESLDFPIIIGTSKENLFKNKDVPVDSCIAEIGVKGQFPFDDIKVIMTPSSKVDMISKMVGPTVPVMSYDCPVKDRFFEASYIYSHKIYFNDEMIERYSLKEEVEEFSKSDIELYMNNLDVNNIKSGLDELEMIVGRSVSVDKSGTTR